MTHVHLKVLLKSGYLWNTVRDHMNWTDDEMRAAIRALATELRK